MSATIHHGDCLEVMASMPAISVDAVVTDPPYGLGFMGKAWDELPPGEEWARECLRVLKPGGHMLAFGGTRTWHRLAVAVEDAGFEIRDSIAWLYGSGFPKSLDVSKAIDKAAGAEREVIATERTPYTVTDQMMQSRAKQAAEGYRPDGAPYAGAASQLGDDGYRVKVITAPATPAAQQWQGWGTALKPAFEPVVVARKPLVGTVAANVLEYGTGALNIDASRIATPDGSNPSASRRAHSMRQGGEIMNNRTSPERFAEERPGEALGRFPANVILDESQAAALDEQSGYQRDGVATNRNRGARQESTVNYASHDGKDHGYGGGGGASRFFYVAKAPKRERPVVDGVAHPTVKPLALMRYLCRLVTPAGGVVLDPFAGSGTTVEAAILEGFQVIGIEREADYLPLIQARLDRAA